MVRWSLGLLLGLAPVVPTLTLAATLAQAVDATNATWTTSGDGLWITVTTGTHDGVDAAMSGAIPDNGQSWLQTSISGVTNVSFWWKVSSEANYDELEFWVDDTAYFGISGEVAWEQRSLALDPGSHTLLWRYAKDPDGASGVDAGWLDQVVLSTIPNTAPAIIIQPTNQVCGAGADTQLQVSAVAYPFPKYQWRFNGTNLAQATDASLTLSTLSVTQAGGYSVVITNTLGSATSQVAQLSIVSLGEALGATNLAWTSGGAHPWLAQFTEVQEGSSAAASGAITDSEESWVQTVVAGPGTLTYWWKVSSESNQFGFGGDVLEILLDGIANAAILGDVSWQPAALAIPSGSHTVRWRYTKDSSFAQGQDRGWVDRVILLPLTPLPFSLSAPLPVSSNVLQLTLTGERGRAYRIETAASWGAWTNLLTFTNSQPANTLWHTQAVPAPTRFYRGVAQ